MKHIITLVGCWLIIHSSLARLVAHRVTHTTTGNPSECRWQ